MTQPIPWRLAWQRALYGPDGFYRRPEGPAGHFATATHGATGAVLAEALLQAPKLLDPLAPTPALVVDVGAGRGELARHLLAAGAPRVLAVDIVQRPADLPSGIEWLRSPGGADLPAELTGLGTPDEPVLVVAHEWLDVVPCTVGVETADGALRELLLDPDTGAESAGSLLPRPEREWVGRSGWPRGEGVRVEVGRQRDAAWAGLVARVRHGTVLAVDYGHVTGERPRSGTLQGFRHGRQVAPWPLDGSTDITAHVAIDTLGADVLLRQHEALDRLARLPDAAGPGSRPDRAGPATAGLARTDPLAYLRRLERGGAESLLRDRQGYGGFWWALQRVVA